MFHKCCLRKLVLMNELPIGLENDVFHIPLSDTGEKHDIEVLKGKIFKLKRSLNGCVNTENLLDVEILEKSRKLDSLLLQYYIENGKK